MISFKTCGLFGDFMPMPVTRSRWMWHHVVWSNGKGIMFACVWDGAMVIYLSEPYSFA